MHARWVKYLTSCELSDVQRAVCALLAELSCSPWKFDVLWDTWNDFGLRLTGFNRLADELLARCEPDLIECAAVVFDDVTIFRDVVGDFDQRANLPREAYRAAYLSMRPVLFRMNMDDAPSAPPTTEEAYLMRMAFVMAMLRPEDVPAFCDVLELAARRYEDRSKSDGARMALQNVAVVRALTEESPPQKVISSFAPQIFEFLFSVGDVRVANELIAQWPAAFPITMADQVRTSDLGPEESSEALETLRHLLTAPTHIAALNAQQAGVASVATSLCLLRRSEADHVTSIELFPPDWIVACQERIVTFGREYADGNPNLKRAFDTAHDYLIRLRQHNRLQDARERKVETNWMAEEGEIWLDFLEIITKRARQEISRDELQAAVHDLAQSRMITPFSIQSILHYGATYKHASPSVSKAALEVASALSATTIGSEDLRNQVRNALGTQTNYRELADEYERQGRTDLACMALYNAAVGELKKGDPPSVLEAAARAWSLVDALRTGRARVPEAAVFNLPGTILVIAALYGRALAHSGDLAGCIEVADTALSFAQGRIEQEFATERAGMVLECMGLFSLTAQCEERLIGVHAARLRMEAAYRLAESSKVPLACCQALCGLSIVALRTGDIEGDLDCLVRAQAFAEQHRRSFPFELDKVEACAATQAAFVWAGEKLISQERAVEALSAFEGLRSRALGDILGIASCLVPDSPLEEPLKTEGESILQSIRTISVPGSEREEGWGFAEHWEQRMAELDAWLQKVGQSEVIQQAYVGMVAGKSVPPGEVREWARRVTSPTAIVWWMLGPSYSYQVVLLARPGVAFEAPVFRRVPVTLDWLEERCAEFQERIMSHKNPESTLLKELSEQLFLPVADLLRQADLVYLCPTLMLHQLPLAALDFDGEPLCISKRVGIVPSLSVLRVLECIDRNNVPSGKPAVWGPDFEDACARVAEVSGGEVQELFVPESPRVSTSTAGVAPLLHVICHAFHEEGDPWQSGFMFNEDSAQPTTFRGRDLLYWRLQARLAILEACDTHRSAVSTTDDSFGIGRFLHLAGVPSIVMSDWEVRADVSAVFVEAMYRVLPAPGTWTRGSPIGRGDAFRAGIRAAREYVGHENFFLWAPMVLVGVVD